ncbi:hypothetical protein KXD40_003293 [Peronospora effusa]|nr:hypothetical protein KXD40_003293 [Peronospora effusa]
MSSFGANWVFAKADDMWYLIWFDADVVSYVEVVVAAVRATEGDIVERMYVGAMAIARSAEVSSGVTAGA